jgi:hypothetical protein
MELPRDREKQASPTLLLCVQGPRAVEVGGAQDKRCATQKKLGRKKQKKRTLQSAKLREGRWRRAKSCKIHKPGITREHPLGFLLLLLLLGSRSKGQALRNKRCA